MRKIALNFFKVFTMLYFILSVNLCVYAVTQLGTEIFEPANFVITLFVLCVGGLCACWYHAIEEEEEREKEWDELYK